MAIGIRVVTVSSINCGITWQL